MATKTMQRNSITLFFSALPNTSTPYIPAVSDGGQVMRRNGEWKRKYKRVKEEGLGLGLMKIRKNPYAKAIKCS